MGHLYLCSEGKWRSYMSGTTWEWENGDWIIISSELTLTKCVLLMLCFVMKNPDDVLFIKASSPMNSLKCTDAFDSTCHSESRLDSWLWGDGDRQMKLSIWPNIRQRFNCVSGTLGMLCHGFRWEDTLMRFRTHFRPNDRI